MTSPIHVRFDHGLGDCANFVRLAQLYRAREIEIAVDVTPDKRWLFEAAGLEIRRGARRVHGWGYPSEGGHEGHGRYWSGNKIAANLSRAPLPEIGDRETLWPELCAVDLDLGTKVSPEKVGEVAAWYASLPRPIVLLHAIGNTNQGRKSLSQDLQLALYREFLGRSDGTLVLLDWDQRVPRVRSPRIRHAVSELGGCSLEQLAALIDQADLLIGVDSGPLHLAGCTRTPAIGVFQPGHYPSTYLLPRSARDNTLSLVLDDSTRGLNRWKRIPFRIVAQPGREFRADWIWTQAERMLDTSVFQIRQPAARAQLNHFVRDLCRGTSITAQQTLADRDRSFGELLWQCARFAGLAPHFVETGTIRSEEDWPGAGFSTYLFGAYLAAFGGTLDSIDLDHGHCAFARQWTRVFGDVVRVHESRGDRWLQSSSDRIDVLYLDSHDADQPGHAESCLAEAQAAWPRLAWNALVLIDDTPWENGWIGKGRLAVPWLVEQGCKILYAGHQVLLDRRPT